MSQGICLVSPTERMGRGYTVQERKTSRISWIVLRPVPNPSLLPQEYGTKVTDKCKEPIQPIPAVELKHSNHST